MEKVRVVFDMMRHMQFAQLSRDMNPIHVDPVAARRTQDGTQIVHGIHSLLRLIECLAESGVLSCTVTTVRAHFRKPIYVSEEATVEVIKVDAQGVRARTSVDCIEVLFASFDFDQENPIVSFSSDEPLTESVVPSTPAAPDFGEIADQSGYLRFDSLTQVKMMFPAAARFIGTRSVAALMCSSCLVGMLVPGLHSLFTGIQFALSRATFEADNYLRYKVLSLEPRFHFARIAILGGGLNGVLDTVSRPPPTKQASIQSLDSVVDRSEFSNVVALVVGGSRGLGELTAKLLAVGGAHVTITYAAGKDDANAIADEIRSFGALCEVMAYDVRKPASAQLRRLTRVPVNQLYYFATPPIFGRKAPLFDERRFAKFNEYYLTAFLDLVRACASFSAAGLKVFYPSTVAIDSRPPDMTEYTMSKAAAEVLISDIPTFLPGVEIVTHRLPRLPTDQTGSVLRVESIDPVKTLLPILRMMHAGAPM